MQYLLNFSSATAAAHLNDLLSYIYHNRRLLALMETQGAPIIIGNGEHITLPIESREAYGGQDLLFLVLGDFHFYFTPEQGAMSVSLKNAFSIATHFAKDNFSSFQENDWRIIVHLTRTIQGAMAQYHTQSAQKAHGDNLDEHRANLEQALNAL